MAYTVSRLAADAGLSADTIRFYEEAGLLRANGRSSSGYRLFEPHQVDRLRFIKGAQAFGLRLREIRELLDIRDRGLCPCGHTAELLRNRVSEVDTELEGLTQLRRELLSLAERFPADECPPDSDGQWPCEQEFIQKGEEVSQS